jgi:thermitase
MRTELKSPQRRPSKRSFHKPLGAVIAALTVFMSATHVGASIPKNFPFTKLPTPTFRNWGITNSTGKSDIDALDAWKIEEGSRDIVVAVIDTGIDATHPDLKPNLWHDKNSPTAVYGWDFVAGKPNPVDDHGHGTHVAGIIGAIANPSAGVSGVAHRVSIMAVKYYSESNSGAVNLANTVKAIDYAVDHGARIINYSGGGPEFSESEYLALKKAEAKGILVVAAAGNERQNTDKIENYYYPAAYKLSNIISVAATDIENRLLASSNWGKAKVDVGAPGENIFSTLPNHRYGQMSGTSQATAFVTGIAALMLSKSPTLTPTQVREYVVASVDKLPTLKDKVSSGGRVNAYHALLALNQRKAPAPQPVKMASQIQPLALPLSRSFANTLR